MVRLHPPAMVPEPPEKSSRTKRLQVPFGSVPLKVDRVVPYGSAGAGGTKASLDASYTLGFHVPDVSNEPSGRAEAAASSKVRLRPVTLPPPPASDSSSIFFPSGTDEQHVDIVGEGVAEAR